MGDEIAFIGFGEAGAAFATAWPQGLPSPRGFDIKTDMPALHDGKMHDYALAGATGYGTAAAALRNARAALSVVTADQAFPVARACSRLLDKGALWLDMNSVAPATKQAAAKAIEAAGGHYVDVAVMAPVHPQRRAVPLLVSGSHAEAAVALLQELGFTQARQVTGGIGAASAIKMIRSVMIKGLEALTAECMLAADVAGVRDQVIASLDASWQETSWAERADYAFDRMIVHGLRRAAEMDEVVKTLEALGTGSAMARAAAQWQRDIGERKLPSPAGLGEKIDAVLGRKRDQA